MAVQRTIRFASRLPSSSERDASFSTLRFWLALADQEREIMTKTKFGAITVLLLLLYPSVESA